MHLDPASLQRQQLTHAFTAARWAVGGLTDEEYLWEPVAACWSVRPREEAASPGPVGRGRWVIDGEWPLTQPPPPTTIGWRLVHLIAWTDVYRDWTFGAAQVGYPDVEVPSRAARAVAELERAQDAFFAEVSDLHADALEELRPVHDGSRRPIWQLVWQIAVEHLHHAAEIGTLRDLRRGRARMEPWPEP